VSASGRAMRIAPFLAVAASAGAVLFALPAGAVLAAGFEVTASVSSNMIGPEDAVTLTVSVSGGSLPRQIAVPDLPAMINLRQGSGASTSSSFRWVNGETSATRLFSWALLPLQEGRAEIPPIEVNVGGESFRTEPIVLQVSATASGQSGGPPEPGRRSPPGSGPGQQAGRGASVLVRAEVDNPHPWAGEPFVLTWKLLTRTSVARVAPDRLPAMEGFLVEDEPVEPSETRRRVVENGVAWDEYVLGRKILTAHQPGRRVIAPAAFRITARAESDNWDPFNRLFGGSLREIARETEAVAVDVRPLPAAGQPPEFSGAVGQFTLRVAADRSEAATGEAVGLRVTVEGEGDLRTASAPAIGPLADFRSWEPKLEEKTTLEGGKRRVRRIWSHVLVPLAPGRQELPGVRFAYFDPKEGAYRVVSAQPIVLTVRRGEGGAAEPGGAVAVGQQEVRAMRQELRALKAADTPLRSASPPFYRSRWWWGLLAVPLLAPMAAFGWSALRAGGAAERNRRRRARAASGRRLKAASLLLGSGGAGASSDAFHDELVGAIIENLAERWDVSPSGLSYERLEEGLVARGVAEPTRRRILAALETFDGARFAPAGPGGQDGQRHMAEARSLVEALDRESGNPVAGKRPASPRAAGGRG